ncbi:MAG: RdgB/HAM1 family non-canonical purine NTP pyrophosphatase [Thermoguttaceae bacterium]
MQIIVLGTQNRKKGMEMAELLVPLGIEIKTLADFPNAIDVVEDGETFSENARKKGTEQARHLNHWVIGEDSGLCVDALKGAPGVFSARFAAIESGNGTSTNSSDDANNRTLLARLTDVPLEKRTAHYTCCAVLSDPAGNVVAESTGNCCGRILFEPSGDGGFGYDPLFEVIEYHRTFGQLDSSVKRAISHRARAMRLLVVKLLEQCSEMRIPLFPQSGK